MRYERRMRSFAAAWLPSLLVSLSAVACSSTTVTSAPAPASAPPVEVPASVDVYEGRPSTLEVSVVSEGGAPTVELSTEAAVEVLAGEPREASPNTYRVAVTLRAAYGVASGPLSVTVTDARGGVETKTVQLTAHHLGWKPSVTWAGQGGPPTREHGVFLLDKDATKAHLIQGSGYSPQWVPIADSWTLDLATRTWSPLTLTGDLTAPMAGMRLAQAPGAAVGYMYGGYTGWADTEKTQEDIYRVDPANAAKVVTKLQKQGDVSARYLHAFAYDADGDQLVGFGGFTNTPRQDILVDAFSVKVSGDAAVFKTLATEGKKPEPRYGMFYAFDRESRRLVVFSGGQIPSATDPINAVNDVWTLDVASTPARWSAVAAAGTVPTGRRNGCSMHDPIGRRLFIFGGTRNGKTTEDGLYVLSLEPGKETWTRLDLKDAPPLRSSGFGFSLPDGSVACAFGNGASVYADVNVLGYID